MEVYMIQLISIISLVKSQNICLDNAVLTCYCQDEGEDVSCTGKDGTNDSFVDWGAFTSMNHRRFSFTFVNLTRLAYSTFTNFSLAFPSDNFVIDFTFINGLDQIGENAFHELNYYSNEPIAIKFIAPQNFELADFAFARGRYFEIVIDSIQYTEIHHRPYQFNLKSMDGVRFYRMSIINSGQIQFVSGGLTTIDLTEITVTNCSVTDARPLIESFSTTLVGLDLSSNHLTEIPSLNNFQEMREIDLKNNYMEEVPANTFDHMANLWRLDFSSNRIKTIAPDAFIGLSLIELELNNNFLTLLETVIDANHTTSFLYPLNQSLAFFGISNNSIRDLNPLKYMINLDNITSCCNQIERLDGNIFDQASRLESVDLSNNQIEFIDPMALNGTMIRDLNLAGNPLSSLETRIETTSFLFTISPTIQSLSFSDCANLIEINWFVIAQLPVLSNLNLSRLNKTDKFWLYRQTDVHTEEYPLRLSLSLNGMQFTDRDSCLSKPIDHILNLTTLFIDNDHPCTCFIFKFKDSLDAQQRPTCLLNDTILNELTNRCADIDSFCESSTTISSFTDWTSSLSTSLNTSTATKTVPAETTHQPSSSSNVSMIVTSTSGLLERSDGNQQKKIILATVIPTIFILMVGFTTVYILKRRQVKKAGENYEMKQKVLPGTDEE